jgi:hypothetical protein
MDVVFGTAILHITLQHSCILRVPLLPPASPSLSLSISRVFVFLIYLGFISPNL